MIFEEVDIFGHVCDFLLDFGELGLYVFEVCFELHCFLGAIVLLGFYYAFDLLYHYIIIDANAVI